MEEGGHHSRHDFRRDNFQPVQEGFFHNEPTGSENFFTDELQPERREGNDLHIITGLLFLSLMVAHALQHWNWYKKVFSSSHFLKNKLLSVTLIVFILLSLSGILLWIEILPGGFINLKDIHAFFGMVLSGLIIIHIVQRYKWIWATTGKLFGMANNSEKF